jgi:hypothetical protein
VCEVRRLVTRDRLRTSNAASVGTGYAMGSVVCRGVLGINPGGGLLTNKQCYANRVPSGGKPSYAEYRARLWDDI